MPTKPCTTAQQLLQTQYNLNEVQINYYDWHTKDTLIAEYIILNNEYDKPILT